MQAIDSGLRHASGCGIGEVSRGHGLGRFGGTSEQRADQLVRAVVFGDLGGKGGPAGVQGIATAISKVLSKADVVGTDVPDDALKKIEASLKKAAQALADRGYDAQSIDATIDRFRSQLADALDSLSGGTGSSAPGATVPDAAAPGTTSGSVTPLTGSTPAPSTPAQNEVTRVDQFVAREVRKQRGSIDILTAEGDRVSIRFKTKDVTNGSVTQATSADGTTITDTRASVVSRGRLQVEVEGDLNEEELTAIGELLTKVDEIATKFFSGDVQTAFAAASELGVDSEQIASYQLDLAYSRKMAAAAWSAARAGVASLPASQPGTQPPAEPSTNGALPPLAEPSASASSSTAAGTADVAPSSDTPAPATAQKTIADFIGDVLSKLGSVEGAGRFSFSMRFKVNVLVTALETVPQATAAATSSEKDSAATNTTLLGDALQKTVG